MVYKTCVLCSADIYQNDTLCINCAKLYKDFRDDKGNPIDITKTVWFKELKILEQRQYAVNRMESVSLDAAIKSDNVSYQIKKNIGRPGVDWRLANKIIMIFDELVLKNEDVSLRKIAKMTADKVSYYTVKNILMKYRHDAYIRICGKRFGNRKKIYNVNKS